MTGPIDAKQVRAFAARQVFHPAQADRFRDQLPRRVALGGALTLSWRSLRDAVASFFFPAMIRSREKIAGPNGADDEP